MIYICCISFASLDVVAMNLMIVPGILVVVVLYPLP